ncbi:hypothetical protein SAMN04487987_102401 [Algibacter pectinivorans]|uniref:Uncharacterized protein n=2 Tax=Algibacter pectinivorans TaxID=870482 RepID=A0A1I1NSH8_9FLAO|nr:hypothetical protein SAMN04487987_102401 [Algibacter pectinivorans]
MKKQITAIFFLVLFMGLMSAPSVIAVLDDSVDTSIFYSIAEEEESGKTKNMLSPFSLENHDFLDGFDYTDLQKFGYYFKNYPKPHLNLISPPPDFIII